MKIHIDVECTPEEARAMFGLPDVKPMQTALMTQIEERMKKTLAAMEPEAVFSTWLPAGVQSFEQWQKFLWGRLTGGPGKEGEEGKKP